MGTWQGKSSGAWRAVSLVPHGAWAIHTLGQRQARQWCPSKSKRVAGNQQQGFPFAGPGLGGRPSGIQQVFIEYLFCARQGYNTEPDRVSPQSVYKLMETDKQMTIQINNKLSGGSD